MPAASTDSPTRPMTLRRVVFLCAAGGFLDGYDIPFWPWSVEQLPTRIRATGQSIGSAGGKLGLLLSVAVFTPQAIETIGWTTYFVLDAAGFAIPVGFVAIFGRETKSNDLDELEQSGTQVQNA